LLGLRQWTARRGNQVGAGIGACHLSLHCDRCSCRFLYLPGPGPPLRAAS